MLGSFPERGVAVVVGSSGGIGRALVNAMEASGRFASVIGLGRSTDPALDITDEASIAQSFDQVANVGPLRLVVNAVGFLHGDGYMPEKANSQIDPAHMARSFAINAIGPALVLKHALPRLARDGKAVAATLSAKVGSIGDNRLGGWHSYRASKSALNQIVRTTAIELSRTHREAVCVAIHPGTVATNLSAPFARRGVETQSPDVAANAILACLDGLGPEHNGAFLDRNGDALPW